MTVAPRPYNARQSEASTTFLLHAKLRRIMIS